MLGSQREAEDAVVAGESDGVMGEAPHKQSQLAFDLAVADNRPELVMAGADLRSQSIRCMYFVDGGGHLAWPAEWQFVRTLDLDHPTAGWILLDILTDHRVGGIEFVSRIQVS